MQTKQVLVTFPESPVLQKRYYMPVNYEVSNAILRGFQIPSTDEVKETFSFTGLTASYLSPTQVSRMFITLCDRNGNEIYKDIPPLAFNAKINGGKLRDDLNYQIDTYRSYVYFIDVTGLSATSYFMFNAFITPLKR